MLAAASRYGTALSVFSRTNHRPLPTPFLGVRNRSFRAIMRRLNRSRRTTSTVLPVKTPEATVPLHINH